MAFRSEGDITEPDPGVTNVGRITTDGIELVQPWSTYNIHYILTSNVVVMKTSE